jgi:hypothetical protein
LQQSPPAESGLLRHARLSHLPEEFCGSRAVVE